MLTYLKVRNLAIVEEFAIEPGAGLNVLTGETGAGKSLLIDSLEFLSGSRGSTETIRTGEEKMSAEAIFNLPVSVEAALAGRGIDVARENGGVELIVRREIAATGRGRVLVNGSPISVRELLGAMDHVLEIHGQDLSHDRIAGQTFRQILDAYAGTATALESARTAFAAWESTAAQLRALTEAQRDRALRLDLLKYQIDEISAAAAVDGEDETLRAERAILANAREMIEATAGAFTALEESDDSALAQISRASQLLTPLARSIPDLERLHGELEDARYRLAEVARAIGSLTDQVRLDPARLEEVEERLVTLDRLKKKYGGSIGEVLKHLEASREEFEQLRDYESSLAKLEREEAMQFEAYRKAADALSAQRREAGAHFESSIQQELQDLAMEGTTVRVAIATASDSGSRLQIGGTGVAFGPEGYDRVEILISPNRGEEPRPMQRIASGGELSRIQLAIAAALFKQSNAASTATLVFDEIDSGIGGRVAEVVGRKLRELAVRNQVLCVTHLPQIASLGTTHFRVWKEASRDRTRALIERLDSREQRVEEIARMLGGERITESARLHATELLERGESPRRGRKAAPAARN